MHYPLATLSEVFVERSKKETKEKNITSSLQHEQQAQDYLTRALSIVKDRCIENSTHEQKMMPLQKVLKLTP